MANANYNRLRKTGRAVADRTFLLAPLYIASSFG
jgi:hypothetical protein